MNSLALRAIEAGIVRWRLGRPGAEANQIARARHQLAMGLGIGRGRE